ncbi:GNAT family N-acetyltransferase [Pareuzebyella sediminis]|uniref:GNAT family N-acetyltransferase n=1 Tax=Pareuzebyella sediminis TaxID=2607998 RepID=UPI0011EF07DC|nr:GNAT family N-acetyltransferase [Pareuzebyella sediminis]
MPYKTFETERLIIRPTTEDDADLLFELLNSPKWLQYIGDRKVKSLASAKEYVKTRIYPQLERLGYSGYTLISKMDHQKIGSCGLYDREGLDGIDIGFALLPKYEQQGFAFEASHRLLHAAFHEFGIHSISAITKRENIASRKLLEKLGLQLSGTISLPNDVDELLVYKIER